MKAISSYAGEKTQNCEGTGERTLSACSWRKVWRSKVNCGRHMKDRRKLSDAISSSELPAFAYKKRCIFRPPKFQLVDEACWKWFCQQWSKGAPVSGVLVQEKAKSFFSKLYPHESLEIF